MVLEHENAEFDEAPCALVALDLPHPHVMSRPCCLMPVARHHGRGPTPMQTALPVPERTRPRAWPMPPAFPASVVSASTISAPASSRRRWRVRPGGNHQFAKLLHLPVLQFRRLVSERFQFGVIVAWFAHVSSFPVARCRCGKDSFTGAECSNVVGTVWHVPVPAESFSREGTHLRRGRSILP